MLTVQFCLIQQCFCPYQVTRITFYIVLLILFLSLHNVEVSIVVKTKSNYF